MEDAHREDLEYLMLRVDRDIPDFLWELPPEELSQIRHFVQKVFEHETAGLEKMMEGGLTMLKFMPKFLIRSLALKHVAPFLVEYTSGKLSLRKELDLARIDYPAEYMGEVLRYTHDNPLCARKLMVQKPERVGAVAEYLGRNYPMKSLDIAGHLEEEYLHIFARTFDFNSADHPLMTPERRVVLDKLRAL